MKPLGISVNPCLSSSPPPATDSSSLRPNSVNRMSSSSYNVMSPSDIVGPSPVTSNGTETTEIEDDVSEDIEKEVSDRKATRRSEVSHNGHRRHSGL